jgi:hypothetical protein
MCSTRPLLPRRVMGGPEALSALGPFWLHQRTCVGPDGTSALGQQPTMALTKPQQCYHRIAIGSCPCRRG